MNKLICKVVFFIIIIFFPGYSFAQDLHAFPGAEGYGKYTTGGRGGDVYEVTNLNDSGDGSLRAAVVAEGPRTVVFRVSGTIELESDLRIENPFITIAGQTAPGDGITIKGYLGIHADEVIIRYIRVRTDGRGGDGDAIQGRYNKNIILNHVSASWGTDEVLSLYHNSYVTIQYSIISEAVGDGESHKFGGIWGDNYSTYHHNLIAHNESRNPRFASGAGHVDFRNNVIYIWGYNSVYGGEKQQPGNPEFNFTKINMIANYYKPGPATRSDVRSRIVGPSTRDGAADIGDWWVSDNFVEGNPKVTADNWLGAEPSRPDVIEHLRSGSEFRLAEPWPAMPIAQQTALEAYQVVLDRVGASFPKRDSVDARIIEEVRSGTVTYGDNGIISSPGDVGGWPELESALAPTDSDHDGMPDWWERANGLDPNDPGDRNDFADDGYTMLEKYLNSLVDYEKNRIKPYDENKSYWQYKGKPVFLLGGNKIANPFQMEENELINYLDELQSSGGNYYRNIMSDREPGNIRAFKRLDNGKYDLTQWNEEYWDKLRNMIKWSSERDIVVNITFWDRFDHYDQTHHRIESRHDLWKRSPWNPVNNVNYSIEESGLESTYDGHPISGINPFHQTPATMQDLPVVLNFQRKFVQQILDVGMEYGNVIYNMGNEHQLDLMDWDMYWGEFVRDYSETQGRGMETTAMFDHVIQVYDEWIEVDGFPPVIERNDLYTFIEGSKLGSQWTDRGEAQYDAAIELVRNTADVQRRPVNAVKVRTQNIVYNPQERLWRLLMGGFAALSHHRDYVEGVTDDGWPIGGLALTEMAKTNIQAMRIFTDIIVPWESVPQQNLLSERDEDEAYLIAKKGSMYGLYFPNESGSVGLDLQDFSQSFKLQWIDIGEGKVVKEEEIEGGSVLSIETPYNVEFGWACAITALE